MKLFKIVFMGLVAIATAALLSSISFAHGDEKAKIKVLNDSAAALAQSNPELAARLTQFANEEANEKDEEMGEKEELEGAQEEAMEKHHMDHIKLLQDSAAALEKSQPELAKSLNEWADHSTKRMEEKEEGKNDTDEMEKNEMKNQK